MPLKINSSGGGSVSINAPVTGSNFSLTVPANNATLITSDGGAITGNVAISGNLSVSGNNINPFGGMRNRIINGAMVIDQRNAGASVTPSSGTSTFITDRFSVYTTQSSKFTAQQNAGSVTPPAGFSNYLGITSSSAYTSISSDLFRIFTTIEGYNIADFAWGTASAKSITLSFWVRSSLTGTFGGCLQNQSNNRAYAFTYSISASNTWEYKTITITGETSGTWYTNNTLGLAINFDFGSGSSKQIAPGSWQAVDANAATGCTSIVGTSGATLYLTGMQVEVGTQATPFDWRPFTTELQLCQRYYQKSYDIGTVPGTASFNGMIGFTVYGSGSCLYYVPYRVSMRPSGSVTFWDAAGNVSKISNFNANAWANNTGTNAVTNVGENSWGLNYGVGGANPWTTGQPALIHYAASAEL